MLSLRKSIMVSLAAISLSFAARAESLTAVHQPEALQVVKDLAVATENAGQTPVAIFDLDDTLINTRERTVRILKDLSKNEDLQKRYGDEALALESLKPEEVRFSLADTLKAKGVTSPSLIKIAQATWNANFFSNKYCADDQPNPGAAQYVRVLVTLGVKIVYLTGRDSGRMQDGTVEDLRKLGFPLGGAQAQLIMKQDIKMDDLSFKISMFPTIAKIGSVVGVFENEPANINAHHEAFPQAVAIFLDTIHSLTMVVPENGILWVKDFRELYF